MTSETVPGTKAGEGRIALEQLTPALVAFYADQPCLIWSTEWGRYWRAEGQGYTSLVGEAGRYTIGEAYAWTKHCDPDKGIMFERTPPTVAGDEQVERLREALEPFARYSDSLLKRRDGAQDEPTPVDRLVFGIDGTHVTIGDLRRARLAFASLPPAASIPAPAASTLSNPSTSGKPTFGFEHAPALAVDAEVRSPYLSDQFEWAAPGDQQEDAWLVRFCDQDVRDAIYTGPNAEAEARAAWERHAPGYNMYLFRLARLAADPSHAPAIERAVALLRRIAARGSWQSHYDKRWEDEAAEILAAFPSADRRRAG